MFTAKQILKALSGIVIAIGALCLGWLFWFYFLSGVFVVIPFMLGYIYIVINLARFKKWAWQVFSITALLAFIIELLFMLLGGMQERLVELFSILIVIVGSVVMTVFGISALVKRIAKNIKERE
jgi:hypothetical protein